jgi:hypothetical protein
MLVDVETSAEGPSCANADAGVLTEGLSGTDKGGAIDCVETEGKGKVSGGAVPENRAPNWTCGVGSPRGAAVEARAEEVATCCVAERRPDERV